MEATYPLCHKELARSKQNTPLGCILRSKAPSRGLWMPELVLYGIRELAQAIPRTSPRHRGGPLSLSSLLSLTNFIVFNLIFEVP